VILVAVGETLADAELLGAVAAALLDAAVDGCAELAGAELPASELAAAELTAADDSGAPDDSPGVAPESATGCGALAGAVLKLSRTTSPATVATKTATNRRMV
jgi:hypothetical protein